MTTALFVGTDAACDALLALHPDLRPDPPARDASPRRAARRARRALSATLAASVVLVSIGTMLARLGRSPAYRSVSIRSPARQKNAPSAASIHRRAFRYAAATGAVENASA